MRERSSLPTLLGEIARHRLVMKKIAGFYGSFTVRHPDWKTIDAEAAMAIAQTFCGA